MTAHLLEVDDLDPVRLRRILDDAVAWKAHPGSIPPALAGRAAEVFAVTGGDSVGNGDDRYANGHGCEFKV